MIGFPVLQLGVFHALPINANLISFIKNVAKLVQKGDLCNIFCRKCGANITITCFQSSVLYEKPTFAGKSKL
jgi:hypothetical protein